MTHARRRQIAREWNRHAANAFVETGNPVYAWDVIATCLSANLTLPPSIRTYLLDAAGKLARLSRDRIPKKGEIDRAIAAALGFSYRGRQNPFSAPTQKARDIVIAFDVYSAHTKNWSNQRKGLEGTQKWDAIFASVATSHGISVPTVKRCWYTHARHVIPRHLLNSSATSKKVADFLI